MKEKLSDISILINGDRGKNYPSQSEITKQDEVPFVNAGHLSGQDICFDDMNYISYEKYNSLNSGKFRSGDILYCLRGSLGKKAIVRDDVYGAVASSLVIIRPDANRILSEYLLFALDSPSIMEQLVKANNGSSQPNLSAASVKNFDIDIPDLAVQRVIVDRLQSIAKLMKMQDEQIKDYDKLIESQFVKIFGDPVSNPMGWKKLQLQEFVMEDCSISYGIVQTGDNQEEGVPVFRPVDIVNRVPKLEELKKTTEEISNKYKRTILKGREMLITVRANIADTYIVGKEFAGCNVGRGIVPIRTKEEIIVLEFLKYQIDSEHLNDYIKKLAKGVTLIQLNMEDLREIEFIVPPLERQRAFIEFAKQVDKLKVEKQKNLEKAQLLFESLMQQYFG